MIKLVSQRTKEKSIKILSNGTIYKNGKCSKDHLVTASFPILNNTLGSEPCGKRGCQVCQFIVNTDNFSPITTDETFKINKGPLNCNSKKVVYLSECKKM